MPLFLVPHYLPFPLCFRLYRGSSSLKVSCVSAHPARLLPRSWSPSKANSASRPGAGPASRRCALVSLAAPPGYQSVPSFPPTPP